MKKRAPLHSLAESDIVMTLLRTRKGDPKSRPWTPVSKDVTNLGGKTFRLRIADVDDRNCLNATVDDVGSSAIV